MKTSLVRVNQETKNYIDFLAKATKLSRGKLLSIILEPIVNIAVSVKPFENQQKIRLETDDSILSQTVTIKIKGRNIITCGIFESNKSEPEVTSEVKQKIEKLFEKQKEGE